MAKRGRESFEKRAREKARLERQSAKRAKRQTDESPEDDAAVPSRAEEDALMKQFAQLSARHEAEQITAAQYEEERHRIFVQLGLEEEG